MKQYEYRTIINIDEPYNGQLQDALNELGKEGWRLCGIKQKAFSYIWIFYREINEETQAQKQS